MPIFLLHSDFELGCIQKKKKNKYIKIKKKKKKKKKW